MRLLLIGCSVIMATTCLTARYTRTQIATVLKQAKNKKINRIKTASGLEYEILQEGTGDSPTVGKEVTVHYNGWFDVDGEPGKLFGSSIMRNKPYTFIIGVGNVIQGWEEGVMTMKVGEKRRFYIPSALGYGSRGVIKIIPANANLIFDVELLEIA